MGIAKRLAVFSFGYHCRKCKKDFMTQVERKAGNRKCQRCGKAMKKRKQEL